MFYQLTHFLGVNKLSYVGKSEKNNFYIFFALRTLETYCKKKMLRIFIYMLWTYIYYAFFLHFCVPRFHEKYFKIKLWSLDYFFVSTSWHEFFIN